MTPKPTEPAGPTLAAVEHYDRRARELAAGAAGALWTYQRTAHAAAALLARARRAELLDPEPSPYTMEPDR
jgi:hypothetical protein